MSDGSKANGTDFERNTNKPDDFVYAIAKIAVGQICENEGFQSFQQSTIEVIADVAVRYVKEIGKGSNLYANLAGRSECNVLDVIRGLEDLGSIRGFPGCSDVHHSLSGSGLVRELRQFVGLNEELPFAYSLPRFPVSKECSLPPSFLRAGEAPPGEHIPAWLPVFPRLSDSSVPECNGGENVAGKIKEEEQARVQERGECSLMSMQQGLVVHNGSEGTFGHGDSSKQKKTTDINPFLAPPLSYGEKVVSTVVPPPRFLGGGATMENHVTEDMMEGFALTVEVPLNKLPEAEQRDKSSVGLIGIGRRAVRFKLSSVRKLKSLPAPTKVMIEDDGDEELASCFETRDADTCENKRRAIEILKESMENPLDPTEV